MEKEAQPTRRQPLILKETTEIKNPTCGEILGGKTAECTAICCCCPCVVLDLVILAVVKLPTGLCKKAIKKRKKRKVRCRMSKIEGVGDMNTGSENNKEVGDGGVECGNIDDGGAHKELDGGGAMRVKEKEKEAEMWARFLGGGFWRNPSGRESSKID